MDKPRTSGGYSQIGEILISGKSAEGRHLRTTEIITFGMGYVHLEDWDFINGTIIPVFEHLTSTTERYQWDNKMIEDLSLHPDSSFNYYAAWLLDSVFNPRTRNSDYPDFNGVPYSSIHHDPILHRFKSMVIGGEGRDIAPRARGAMAVLSAMKQGAPLSNDWTGGFSPKDLDAVSEILERGRGHLHYVNYPMDYAAVVKYVKDLKKKAAA